MSERHYMDDGTAITRALGMLKEAAKQETDPDTRDWWVERAAAAHSEHARLKAELEAAEKECELRRASAKEAGERIAALEAELAQLKQPPMALPGVGLAPERLAILAGLAERWLSRAHERPVDGSVDALTSSEALSEALRGYEQMRRHRDELARANTDLHTGLEQCAGLRERITALERELAALKAAGTRDDELDAAEARGAARERAAAVEALHGSADALHGSADALRLVAAAMERGEHVGSAPSVEAASAGKGAQDGR